MALCSIKPHLTPLCSIPRKANFWEDHLTEPGTCGASYRELLVNVISTDFKTNDMISHENDPLILFKRELNFN